MPQCKGYLYHMWCNSGLFPLDWNLGAVAKHDHWAIHISKKGSKDVTGAERSSASGRIKVRGLSMYLGDGWESARVVTFMSIVQCKVVPRVD